MIACRAAGSLALAVGAVACTPQYSRWANGAQDPGAPAVVFLGDSLTFGQGVQAGSAYPALIAERMRKEGIHLPVVNAGVSGDTTADGLARLPEILAQPVAVLVVALGANDGLRHEPLEPMRRNLAEIVERGQQAGAQVVMVGMKAPPFDPAYRAGFFQVFADLAREYRLAYVPFLLEGVGGVPGLNQADGIHPNAEGHRIMADVVWRVLEPVVLNAARSRTSATTAGRAPRSR